MIEKNHLSSIAVVIVEGRKEGEEASTNTVEEQVLLRKD
jgi:hypothetical protein